MFNVAVVGCGYWGPNLIRNFSSLSDCRVKSVCDTNNDRLRHIQGLNSGIEVTSNLDDLLTDESIDAIAIAVPTCLHFEIGKKCLQAGKHVLIEKPLTRTIKECEELIELAEMQKLVLMFGRTFIYSPPVRSIKEIVASGELGDIQYISSRRLNLGLFQKDINVAWDLAPHDISIILYILNEDPVSVNCQGKSHITNGIEDVTNMTLNLTNGAFATIQSSWPDPNKVRETMFVGSKKILVYDELE